MADQQLLVETLVALADTLVDDYDVIDFMQTLAERSVDLLDASAAGIMLAGGDGRLRHAACSSEQMRLVELLELQLQEGPCFEAFERQTAGRSGTFEGGASRRCDQALARRSPAGGHGSRRRRVKEASSPCPRSRCGCAEVRSAR